MVVSNKSRDDFLLSYTDEPHASRRKIILKKYPQIEKLFGPDSRPVPYVIAIVISQFVLAYAQRFWSFPFFLFVAWAYGGAASHSLSLMTHEVSHNLVFESKFYNDYFGIFCNIGMGLPTSTMFKRYHMEHHLFQGVFGKDVDIPTHWEGRMFTGIILKMVWLFLQPVFYAVRPTLINHKDMRPLDVFNISFIALTDAVVVILLGPRALLYLTLSTLLGMGIHPVAGHFISEHYMFQTTTHDTFSYYGPLNLICWNVGYHNEHHDFPRVPGWKLPLVKEIAKEFYEDLPHHNSWIKVLYDYIVDPTMCPFSRVVRSKARGNKVPELSTLIPEDNTATTQPPLEHNKSE